MSRTLSLGALVSLCIYYFVLFSCGFCDSLSVYGFTSFMIYKCSKQLIHVLVHVLQSNEVAGSYHMELEGLKRCVSFLTTHDLAISTIVTDRHVQIAKWLRENMQTTNHYFDIWHVAKGTFYIQIFSSSGR